MKFFFILLLLSGCSTLTKPLMPEALKGELVLEGWRESKTKFTDHSELQHQIVWQDKFWVIPTAKSVSKSASALTLAAWIKVSGKVKTVQDLIGLSIQSTSPTRNSRASLRIHSELQVATVARSEDQETGHLFMSKESLPAESWVLVMTVIDYQNNKVSSFLNGVPLTIQKEHKLKKRQTEMSDSWQVALGAEDDGSDFYLLDELQEVMIWRRALSADDAKLLYDSQKAAFKLP